MNQKPRSFTAARGVRCNYSVKQVQNISYKSHKEQTAGIHFGARVTQACGLISKPPLLVVLWG